MTIEFTQGEILKTNLTATTDPGAGDDITQGYEVGSIWVNIASETYWVAVNTSPGSAVWKRLPFDENTIVVSSGDVVTAAGNVVVVTPAPTSPYP